MSRRQLVIADKLHLPADGAVTQPVAILGQRGSGKTYTAKVIAEEMAKAMQPWVVLDPLGVWWGLRSSASGTDIGFSAVILGGDHADRPLEVTGGEVVADYVVDEPSWTILDLSHFRKAELRRFSAAFLGRLYHRNRDALHVFVDEADLFAPQKLGQAQKSQEGDAYTLLGTMEDIVRRGRSRGMGCTLITQRPAVLSKDVLTQVGTIVAHRITGRPDRNAIDSWVEVQGNEETAAVMMGELPSLKTGTAYWWSPEWLGLFGKYQTRKLGTYDSSATPKGGSKARMPRAWTPVDLDVLDTRIKDTIERAKENDPKALRAEVAKLRGEITKRDKDAASVTARLAEQEQAIAEMTELIENPLIEMHQVIPPGLADELDGLANGLLDFKDTVTKGIDEGFGRVATLQRHVWELKEHGAVEEPLERPQARPERPRGRPAPGTGQARLPAATRPPRHQQAPKAPPAGRALTKDPEGRESLSGTQCKVLDALAWWSAVGIERPTKIQVGFIAGYRVSKNVGGTYGNILGQLRSAGLINYPTKGSVALTEAGRAVAAPVEIEQTTEGLQGAIFERLKETERKVLQPIVDAYPEDLSKQEAGALAGYSVSDNVGGTFGNILGRLRSLGLIDYPDKGRVAATDMLFL